MTSRDLVRVNPSFFGRERYDSVMYQATESTASLGRVLSFFSITVEGSTHQLALIIPYDRNPWPDAATRQKDKDLGFLRVSRRSLKDSEVISADSIIRSCVLVRAWDSDYPDDHILNDCVDTDWWLRAMKLRAGQLFFSC